MPATPFDSAIWRGILFDAPIATLFTDTAVLRSELLVMGTLALTQAKAGTVPELSAQAIQRAAMEIQVDPAALGPVTSQTGDPVAALVAAFRDEMKAPEHAQWVFHDGDSLSLKATAQSLRLKQVIGHLAKRTDANVQSTLDGLCDTVLLAFHPDSATRAGLAAGLGLKDAGDTPPATAIAALASWITTQAQAVRPQTELSKTLCQTLPTLAGLLDDQASPLTTAMILPQLCLGIGVLLR